MSYSRRDLPAPLLRTAGRNHLSEALGKPAPWMAEALCAQADPDCWFPDHGRSDLIKQARDICRQCPVSAQCFEAGAGEVWGIWAGTTEQQRVRLRSKRRKGAA